MIILYEFSLNGLIQKRSNSIANAQKFCIFCINPLRLSDTYVHQ